jgi:hypothetical protein
MVVDFKKLDAALPSWAAQYRGASPFPHIVIDNFLERDVADQLFANFPNVAEEGWIHYVHYNERKHGLNKIDLLPKSIQQCIGTLNSTAFLSFLTTLTGIKGLLADTSLEGGGLHQTERHGNLNIHADFMVHTHHTNWLRRINILIYLNPDWKEEYNGHLELWRTDMSKCESRVLPIHNRCVIFNTTADSFHGVPDEVLCPPNMTRKSIALYYFTEESNIEVKNPTNYKARPTDSLLKKAGIYMDKQALWTYTKAKRVFGFNDDFVSKILNKFK